jgi:hypothetical protein
VTLGGIGRGIGAGGVIRTNLRPHQLETAASLIRAGYTRQEVRATLRREYDVGIGNNALAQLRAHLRASAAPGEIPRAGRRPAAGVLDARPIPTITREGGRSGRRMDISYLRRGPDGEAVRSLVQVYIGDRPVPSTVSEAAGLFQSLAGEGQTYGPESEDWILEVELQDMQALLPGELV